MKIKDTLLILIGLSYLTWGGVSLCYWIENPKLTQIEIFLHLYKWFLINLFSLIIILYYTNKQPIK
jgi:hypothetical protein